TLSSLIRYVLTSPTFSFADPSNIEIYTLSLHDALPILPMQLASVRLWLNRLRRRLAGLYLRICRRPGWKTVSQGSRFSTRNAFRSEEHTSELQSRFDLVCRLLLEKKNIC